ncbi:hypothetical protein AGOR_G00077140 [Albula goreensis]|uniref:Uncharacterized protein n=1 Tax=Albula goreensis TaxID=1534307 RepID=A0A8T3DW33_9TELE|nr:hypothetical protein AGOR_G00077140 [Albula goreensis]
MDQHPDGKHISSVNYEDESFDSCSSIDSHDSRCTTKGPPTDSCSVRSNRADSYGSDSFLSFDSADQTESKLQTRPTSSVEAYKSEDFEQYDENESTMEEERREKWIGILRTKALPSSIPPPKQRSNSRVLRGGGRPRPEERVALKAFCQDKIRRVQSLRRTNPSACRAQLSGQTVPCPEMAGFLADRPVPKQFISVLRLKSFTEEMKQAAGTELHEPSHCRACQEKQAKLAQDTFIRRKKSQLESWLLKDRVQAHLCERDTICLVGELLGDIPSTSDDPSKIWEGLLTNGHWTPQ